MPPVVGAIAVCHALKYTLYRITDFIFGVKNEKERTNSNTIYKFGLD